MLGGGFGLYQAGLVKLPAETDPQLASALSAAERKIADLESKLGALGSTVAGQNNSGDLAALEEKVTSLEGKLEEAQSAASADAAPDVSALKSDIEDLRGQLSSAVASATTGGSGDGAPVNLKPLEDRLAKLESEASAATSETDTLSGSVSGLEKQLSGLTTDLSGLKTRLDNTEATAKAAQTAVSTSDTSLKTLADSQARATETLTSLSADIKAVGAANDAALEDIRAELKSLSARLEQVESTMGDATAREVAARALSVSALKSAVDSGRPYETELAAVKAGLPADIDLAGLESHAKTGVEPASVLIAKFPPVARGMYQTFAEPDRSGDVLDSLLASAKSIVTVRGLNDGDGSGPEAVLQRMESAVSTGDLEGALTAYAELPDAAKAAGVDWADKARARVEVDALTDKASQEVLNELAAKDS
ncbi:hypothetical protein JF539_26790 [Labrenzia aggregata]|uniref:Inner membrane protein n=1 Tax=Roseibium aggregatum TaxID=187304 RepID=A0A939J4W2_9HYPH|nr:hypothetical protein [Roseibium aggregatum]